MINGIINVYKEPDFTSFDVVAKMRGMLKIKKIGHTGTLDPDAVGVLPICIGNATKVVDLLTDETKEYVALLRLGITTDTLDTSGNVLSNAQDGLKDKIKLDKIEEAIKSFVGDIEQIPPMYSALKVNGQKLCDLARKGIKVERKSRKVSIFSIDIVNANEYDFHHMINEKATDEDKAVIENDNAVRIAMRVVCSKGTYIRTLCEDIGKILGCGGCMEALIRSRVGGFELDNAYKLSELQRLVDDGLVDTIVSPVDSVFNKLSKVYILSEGKKALDNGNKLEEHLIDTDRTLAKLKAREEYRVYDNDGRFYGIYEYHSGYKMLKPVKMFLPVD